MFVTYVVVAIVTIVVVRYVRKYLAYRTIFNNMPGEKEFSYLKGTMHLFPGVNEEGLAYDMTLIEKFAYFFRVWVGPFKPIIVVYHPEAIRAVIKSQAEKPRGTIVSTSYDMGLPWLGEGLLIANGQKWARSRRLLTPAFHFDILKPYMNIYNRCTDILMEKILTKSKEGVSFDIYSLINLEALDIILRCAFSYQSDCQTTQSASSYVQAISEIQIMWANRSVNPNLVLDFLYKLTSEGKKFYRLCNVAHQVADEVIGKRKKELEKDPSLISKVKVTDFLDTLLAARDEDGNGLTSLEIRNEVDTFLFEGHDTTASGMTWTLYSLAAHPEYQERVFEEVTQVIGDKDIVEWDDLSKLEFTTMCIKEALRLHSTVPFIARRTTQEIEIQGYRIPADTYVGMHLYLLHHNPHLWDNPNEFLPERFQADKARFMDPFQFIPFSAGSRNCIGQNFAMNEMKTTIAKVIKKFKLSIDTKMSSRRLPSVTMKPEKGAFIFAESRT